MLSLATFWPFLRCTTVRNPTLMVLHYLRTFFRNIRRHKSAFAINLVGLTSGLACTIFIYLWVQDEYAYDKMYLNQDRIYRVMEHFYHTSEVMTTNESSGPLAEVLKNKVPEISYAAPIAPS